MPPDLQALARGRTLNQMLWIGPEENACLEFSIAVAEQQSGSGPPIQIEWDDGVIRVSVLPDAITGMLEEGLVGQEVEQEIEGRPTLRLVVERDLKPNRA
jgi:hypothetical protein